ncbi:MAG: hypothetical protein AB8F78_08860 [Saprospiraceae bacterium]
MHRFCFLILLFSFAACTPDGPPVPDVSALTVDLKVRRFEYDLAAASQLDSTQNGAQVLREAYPVFFDSIWLELLLPGKGRLYDSAMVVAWQRQPSLRKILDSVQIAFPLSEQAWERDLAQAFKYAKHYFPEKPTPSVVTYPSELSLGAFTYGDNLLGIGLDFYLGNGFSAYDPMVIPRYIQRSMNADHIASRAMEAWISEYIGDAPGDRMLDRMLHNGKMLYIKARLLPHVADTAVLGFSKDQLAWLESNELEMWAHYLDKELLYETNTSLIGKHVGPSPNAPGMPPEAPGGNANWVGMRIIEQYVARRPDLDLQGLIDANDSQRILTESKYKPKR